MQNCRSSLIHTVINQPSPIGIRISGLRIRGSGRNINGRKYYWIPGTSFALFPHQKQYVKLFSSYIITYYRYHMFVFSSISYYVSLSQRVSFSVEMCRYLIIYRVLNHIPGTRTAEFQKLGIAVFFDFQFCLRLPTSVPKSQFRYFFKQLRDRCTPQV